MQPYIYKIYSPLTSCVYYGSSSSSTLNQRLSKHKCHYKRYKNGQSHWLSSFTIFEIDNSPLIALVESPVDNMLEREAYYIQYDCNAVNVYTPNALLSVGMKEYVKQYYHNNKISVVCYCGGKYNQYTKKKHLTTFKHINYVE